MLLHSSYCVWTRTVHLCRRMLQYALGVETVLLVILFAFYARITRQAAQQGLECDEVTVKYSFTHDSSGM